MARRKQDYESGWDPEDDLFDGEPDERADGLTIEGDPEDEFAYLDDDDYEDHPKKHKDEEEEEEEWHGPRCPVCGDAMPRDVAVKDPRFPNNPKKKICECCLDNLRKCPICGKWWFTSYYNDEERLCKTCRETHLTANS